ncbi:MAG: hypothetical protein PHT60_14060 [Acidiphilium sp.]|nr:hypothetical protein [Acidiphilium sp.]MDD4936890.1 hypothetical protein [Acidiphilium sp.]
MGDFEIVTLDPAIADRPSSTPSGIVPVREIRFHSRGWMPAELDRLREMIGAGTPWEEIAIAFNRTIETVKTKAWERGLYRPKLRPWTEDEDRVLVTEYGTVPTATLAIRLERGVPAIYVRAGFLGLQKAAPPPWSEAEDAVLREVYATDATIAEIAARLGRPGSGVISRASHLGLRRPEGPKPWHPDEQALALKLAEEGHRYPSIRRKLAAKGFPPRAESTFQAFIAASGYQRGWGRPWIEEECDLLRLSYQTGGNLVALAHQLGRSRTSIRWKAAELHLSGTHPKPNGARQGRPWTEADDQILRANYGRGRMKTADLARLLDRPKSAVYNRAFTLGLDHGYCRDWTQDEDLLIRIAHAAGVSITDLAQVVQRDPTIVSKRAIKLGLPFSRRNRTAPRNLRADRPVLDRAAILALAAPTGPAGDPWRSFKVVQVFGHE